MELQDLVNQSGENAESKGFHDEGNKLRAILGHITEKGSVVTIPTPYGDAMLNLDRDFWERIYAAYKGNRLMLIVGELVETHEEVRSGKPTIYAGENGKPEGTAVELADTQIRLADYAWEFGEPLQGAIDTKARYNETRSQRHGGRLF